MKAKTVLIILIVALLCTSIASAGFTEWVTGKAISLKSFFQKSTAKTAEVKAVAGNNAATQVSPTEFDSNVKANELAMLPDNAFWVHIENRLMQADNWITQFDKQEVSGVNAAARAGATNAPAASRNLAGVRV